MYLLPTEQQLQIVETARRFLADSAPVSRFRDSGKQIGNDDAGLLPALAELGLLGAGLGEASGGAGFGAPEEALIFREYGRALVSPIVLGAAIGARIADAAGRQDIRDAIVAGASAVAVAHPRRAAAVGRRCTGSFQVFEAPGAAWALVLGETGAGLLPAAAFAGFEAAVCTDALLSLRRGDLREAACAEWLPAEEDDVGMRAILLLGCYCVGLAEATRDMAVGYAQVREQFGRPIGAFQAIKHKCAEMAVRAEAALCQSWFAAAALEEGAPDAAFQARACKIVGAKAAAANAADNIQIHGAIGFTSEIDAHLFVKRSLVVGALGGDLRAQRSRFLKTEAPI